MADRGEPSSSSNEKRPGKGRGYRRGYEPYVPPSKGSNTEAKEQQPRQGFLGHDAPPTPRETKQKSPSKDAPKSTKTTSKPKKKHSNASHEREREREARPSRNSPPRQADAKYQAMEDRLMQRVEQQVMEKLARASVLSVLYQQHKSESAAAATTTASVPPSSDTEGSSNIPAQSNISASDRAFERARQEHARQRQAEKKVARHISPPALNKPTTPPVSAASARITAGTDEGDIDGPTTQHMPRIVALEERINEALQQVKDDAGQWQDFCVLGAARVKPGFVSCKSELLGLYSECLCVDPVGACNNRVANRAWILHHKELEMYNDALRSLNKNMNPFVQVSQSTRRHVTPANIQQHESALSISDMLSFTKQVFSKALEAAAETIADLLAGVTKVEKNHRPQSTGEHQWAVSVRDNKHVILTALGDLTRYHTKIRAEPNKGGRARPTSADYNYAMQYYNQAKQEAPWSGRVLQHMGMTAFNNDGIFDAVCYLVRSMCVRDAYPSRETLLDVFERCRTEVENMGSVTALSGLSFSDHSSRFKLHFLACAGIGYTRTGADRFSFHLERCRRHLSTMIQTLPMVTNNTQRSNNAAAKANFYDFQGPLGRDVQPTDDQFDSLSAHRYFKALEDDCYKSILICISLLHVVTKKHGHLFESRSDDAQRQPGETFTKQFHAVRSISGLLDIVRMLISICAAIVGADGIVRGLGWEPAVAKAVCLFLDHLEQNLPFAVIRLLDEEGWDTLQKAMFPYVASLPRVNHSKVDVLPEDDDLEGFEPVNKRILQMKVNIVKQAPPVHECSFKDVETLHACMAARSVITNPVIVTQIRAARARTFLRNLSSHAVRFDGYVFDKNAQPLSDTQRNSRLLLHAFEVPDLSRANVQASTRQAQGLLSAEEFMQALGDFTAVQQTSNAEEPVTTESDQEDDIESVSSDVLEEQTEEDGQDLSGDDVETKHEEITSANNSNQPHKAGLLVGIDMQAIRAQRPQVADIDNDAEPIADAKLFGQQHKSPNRSKRQQRVDRHADRNSRPAPLALAMPRRGSEDLPLIVVDAANVAMRHGMKQTFSCRGIQLAINFFKMAGHEVVSFLPDHYLDFERIGELRRMAKVDVGGVRAAQIPDDIPLLQELVSQGVVVGTPPQDYDDSYCITYARHRGGYVVTNDLYRDHVKKIETVKERESLRKWIKEHCISYTFVKNEFIPNPDFNFKR